MLSNFNAIRILRIAFFFVPAFFLFTPTCFAQSLGDPIVNITFGSGNSKFGGPLAADSGSTTYPYYFGQGFPPDGQYTIINTSAGMLTGLWVTTTDHTGNPGGYFMLVNADDKPGAPGLFFTRKVTALCPGTEYQFGAFVKNMFANSSGKPPNVTFQIETEGGGNLGSYSTGDVPANGSWNPYNMKFTTPINTGTIVLKMINNGLGGFGNDLAIDDITFRPYGDPVKVEFDQSTQTQICAGSPQTVTIKSTIAPSAGYSQKIQQKVNGAWTNMPVTDTGNGYTFTSPSVAGTYTYRVISGQTANIGNSQCVVASNELTLTILPQPTPAFTAPDNACIADPVVFQDNSAPNGTTITSWQWDFGDGTPVSTEQTPSHVYAASGDYTVKLSVTNGNNCISAPATKNIHINDLPLAATGYTFPICATRQIEFRDLSTAPTGATITSRVWEIEGVVINRPDAQPFPYTFTTAGTYPVKLTVTSSTGCSSSVTSQVTVNPLPVLDFDTPPTCVSDNAVFTNRTTIADNSPLTYSWNFGDGTPVSTDPNPLHKYQAAGDYNITLSVKSGYGCVETLTKNFRVNGATPEADFTVLDKTKLYSNREVVIENKSHMQAGVFGNVTRVEIYYDYPNDLSQVEIDNNPTDGKLYRHTYPEFHSGTKSYTVRMLAYSGGVCVSQEKTDPITLLATPLVVFTQPAAICANATPFQLDGHDESNSGLAGTGTYTGTGVSASGLFDPAISGAGTFTITYTYTFTGTGSSNSIDRYITVDPLPTVEVSPGLTILEGGSGVLNAKATGNGLSYSWSPASGLNNANIANPTVAITSDATYRLTVTNDKGCQQFADVLVTVLKKPLVPNTFTPNGDGINDTWTIRYLDSYPGCTVNIFNRYGLKVFTSTGYPAPWDGRSNRGDLATGVYYYIIDPKNGRKAISGYVTIVK